MNTFVRRNEQKLVVKEEEEKVKKYTIRYDTVSLTCGKKLTDSQFSLPHVMNKKRKRS